MRQWISVINGGHVQLAVVSARAPRPVGLGDDVQRGRPGGARRADDPKIKHLLEFCFSAGKLVSHETAGLGKDRRPRSRHSVLNAVGWRRVRIVVGDEDGRELVEQGLDLGRPWAVQATEMWRRPIRLVGRDDRKRGQ